MQPPALPSLPPEQQPAKGDWKAFTFNAYLLSFLAEGALTVLAAIPGPVGKFAGGFPLSLAGMASMTFALLVILVIGSFRSLPWRAFAPALAFSIWEGCIYLPLPAFVDWRPLVLSAACLQLLIGGGTLMALHRASSGRSMLLRTGQLVHCPFSLSRTFLAGVLKLFILTPLLLAYIGWSAQVMLKKASSGFLQLDTNGLFTEARTYEKDGHKIYLLPTVHIASPNFYEMLMESLPAERSVILPEGVTDDKKLMRSTLDYSIAADSVGLSAQPDLTKRKQEPNVLHCDADISDFSESTIRLLNAVTFAMHAASDGDALGAIQALTGLENAHSNELIEDILEKRNQRVSAGVEKALPLFEHIAIPWGVAHMPGIERDLFKMRARKTDSRRVQVFNWRELRLFPEK